MNNIYYVDSVVIQNMRKFEVRTFRFKPHCVNYLVGSNGCGKSTVLNAIQLALLGYIPGKRKEIWIYLKMRPIIQCVYLLH